MAVIPAAGGAHGGTSRFALQRAQTPGPWRLLIATAGAWRSQATAGRFNFSLIAVSQPPQRAGG
jgi:hypothetical protein